MGGAKVWWFLSGPRTTASSRLHGYRVHEYLRSIGRRSAIILDPTHNIVDIPFHVDDLANFKAFAVDDIVVFQKLQGRQTIACMQYLKQQNLKLVMVDCDYPLKIEEAKLADLTVCSADALAKAYRKDGIRNVIVIPEAYEGLAIEPRSRRHNDRPKVRCVWFGSMDPLKELQLRKLKALMKEKFPRYELLVVTNHPQADHKWDLKTCWRVIGDCDVALVTGDNAMWSRAKSFNRVIQAMALGLAVISFPTPAARKVIRHGRNGFLCEGDEEWCQALQRVGSVQARSRVAKTGFRYAKLYFSMNRVGSVWADIFDNLSLPYGSRCEPRMLQLRLKLLHLTGMWRLFCSVAPIVRFQLGYLGRIFSSLVKATGD